MTLHVVLGDGYMPTKELTAHLEDLRQKALADDDGFWFVVAAKPEPTDTDRALVTWLSNPEYDIYWDAIGDKDGADKLYKGAQNIYKAARLAPKVVDLMNQAKAGGVDEDNEPVDPEDADLLALFFSDEEDAEEDGWLNDVISAVSDVGYPVYALNDGMTLLDPDDDTGVEEEEGGEEEEVEGEADSALTTYTREQLGEMDLDELKKIAIERGITVAPRSRKPTYIEAIAGEEVAEVEVEEAPKPLTSVPAVAGGNASTIGANVAYTSSTTSGTLFIGTEITGPAMVVVIYNGQVTSRIMTVEQARTLLSSY